MEFFYTYELIQKNSPCLEKQGLANQLPLTIKPYHHNKDEAYCKMVGSKKDYFITIKVCCIKKPLSLKRGY